MRSTIREGEGETHEQAVRMDKYMDKIYGQNMWTNYMDKLYDQELRRWRGSAVAWLGRRRRTRANSSSVISASSAPPSPTL